MIKGVITFSCLPESSRRILPLLQYFNFHGLRQSSRRYVYFCRYVCIHRLPAARRKKKLQKKNVSQVLETKFVIFIISRSRSENAGLWGAQSGFFNKGKLVILRNATTLYNQSWPLFSSAVMALYWDPVPFILIGRFMKNNAMSAHGKD